MDDYPLLNLFWTMLWLFLWILWLFLLIRIISDIFRSHDLGGWGKAAWLIFVVILPFLGVLVYVIARGHSMSRRDQERAAQADAAFKEYVRDAAGGSGKAGGASSADELSKLAELKAQGSITDEEFQRAKSKILA